MLGHTSVYIMATTPQWAVLQNSILGIEFAHILICILPESGAIEIFILLLLLLLCEPVLRHVLRHDSLLQKVIEGRFQGKKTGRPRTMLLDALMIDARR